MKLRSKKPFEVGQRVIVIDYDYDTNKSEARSGEVVAKRQKIELASRSWEYLVKIDDGLLKLFDDTQVWLTDDMKNETRKMDSAYNLAFWGSLLYFTVAVFLLSIILNQVFGG